jgi:hypothetical protein
MALGRPYTGAMSFHAVYRLLMETDLAFLAYANKEGWPEILS